MNATDLFSRLRKLPLAVIVPASAVIVVVVLVAIAGVTRHASPAPTVATTRAKPVVGTTPPMGPPSAAPVAIQSPPTAPAVASTTPPPAPAIRPPAGAKAGSIAETVMAKNPFGQWITVDHKTVTASQLDLSFPAVPHGSPDRRTAVTAWFRAASQAPMATLRVRGPMARVGGSIDGVPLSTIASGSAQTAVGLSAGWHTIALQVDQAGSYSTDPVQVQIQLGSGDVDPVVPVPWAVPPTTQPAAITPAKPATAAKPAAASTTPPMGPPATAPAAMSPRAHK